jgi:Tir chaperone family protein CesT
MLTKEDIEGFLDRLSAEGASYKEVQPGLWVVKPGGAFDFDMVVHYSPPVVLLRVKVMDLPKEKQQLAELSRRLLELNASDMVHGAYGIEQNSNSIVLTEALELEHLDFEEFLAAYESMTLALASHLREIGSYRGSSASAASTANAGRSGGTKGASVAKSASGAKSASAAKGASGAKGAKGAKGGRR